MISEIIVSKILCGSFSIFCRLGFINDFIVKNSFAEPENHQKLNISRPIYFKKHFAHCFEDPTCTNKLEVLFSKKRFFQGLGAFFTTAEPLIWVLFKCDYLILTQY